MIDLNKILDNPNVRIDTGNFFATGPKDMERAGALYESALDLDPVNVSAMSNAAFVALKQKDLFKAEKWIKQALGVAPNHSHALATYALITQEMTEFECARVLFEHSIRQDPKNTTTLLNYAYMLQLIGDYRRGFEIYTQARDMNPMDFNTRFQRSMCLMTIAETPEQWQEALAEYELRHMMYNTRGPVTDKPMWTGSGVNWSGDPDRLLIVTEQGIGDSVMVGRYVRMLKKDNRFDIIYVYCTNFEHVSLMRLIEGVDGVYSDVKQVPAFEYYIPAMSLMKATGYPTIKADASPYLEKPDYTVLTEDTGNIKVGICWSGNPAHGNDRWRSIGVDVFCDAFAGVEDVDFYSLHRSIDVKAMPEFVRDPEVDSLVKLAATIKAMDLVITVDTAQLHIAGAMGVPCLGLLASNPDFRWGNKGQQTHWYPSVTLFRAMEPMKWKPVLGQAREHLLSLV